MKWIVKENDWYWEKIPEEFRNRLGFEIGWGNGYVIVPKEHPLFGKSYYELSEHVSVHGGLTFGQIINDKIVELFNLDKDDLGSFLYGFDTAHYEDNLLKWPKELVEKETQDLANQLEQYALNNEREN